jgi:hypothetical protein
MPRTAARLILIFPARIAIHLGHHFHTVSDIHQVFYVKVEKEVKANEAEATNFIQSRRTEYLEV